LPTLDPEEEEIAARAARIMADAHAAHTIRSASWPEIAQALLEALEGKVAAVDDVARMDVLRCRLPATPGVAHGVGQALRRVGLLIEARRRILEDLGR